MPIRYCRLFALPVFVCLLVQYSTFADERKLSKSDRRWLEQEVGALITEEEVKIFGTLDSKEDRSLFKKLFWARRDPDLMSRENEFKEKYEKMLKFADRSFRVRGVNGGQTDRGRTYLLLGPPDHREQGYEGGLGEEGINESDRSPTQSGGQGAKISEDSGRLAGPHRLERTIFRMAWFYRPDPDRGVSSELRILFDSQPGFGYYFVEPLRVGEILERFKSKYIYHDEIDYGRDPQGRLLPLPLRLDSNSPAKEALRRMLATKVEVDEIGFQTEMAFFKSTESAYIPLLFEIPVEHLKWKRSVAKVSFFGCIEGMDGRPVRQFEEQATLTRTQDSRAVLEIPVQLEPGSYTFSLGVMDLESKKVGTRRIPVFVPTFKQGGLDKSSVVLYTESRRVEEPPGTMGHAFQFGQTQFTPAGGKVFRPGNDLGILFFVYGFGVDGDGRADLASDYVFFRNGEEQGQIPGQALRAGADQAVANVQIPLEEYEPGSYQVEVRVTDHLTNQTLSDRVDFILEPEPYAVAEYSELVESFRDGRFRQAASALALVSRSSLERAADEYRKASTDSGVLGAAALLHTETAVANLGEVPFHLGEARAYLNRIDDPSLRTSWLRQWFLSVSYFLRSSTAGWGALPTINEALDLYPDDPEIRIAVGSVYETAGWRGIEGMLDRAEGVYRGVATAQPGNVEARLRLGRVLQLKKDWAGAIRELKWSLEHSSNRADRVVSSLLLGSIYYELEDLPNAVRFYGDALEAEPGCQVAAVALSHALHRSGDWAGSREIMDGFFGRDGMASDGPDEWKRFTAGRADQLDAVLQEMREEVLR